MKNIQVMILLALGIALAALAWFSTHETAHTQMYIGKTLLPELPLNTIDEIVVASATETSRVVRTESGWTLPDQFGYPANFEAVRQLLLKLEQLKIGQVLVSNIKQRELMSLTPDKATTVTLSEEGHPVAVLLLGANHEPKAAVDSGPYGFGGMPDGRFVALPNDPSVYLIGDVLYEVATSDKRWIDSSLLDVSQDAVTFITIENPEDGSFTLNRTDDNKLTLSPTDDEKPFDETKSSSLLGALSYLTLQSVANPALEEEALGFSEPRTFTMATKDGTRYTIHVSKPLDNGEERNIRIAVSFEAPVDSTVKPDDTATPEAKAAAEKVLAAKATETKAAGEKAAELNKRLSPWTFRIPGYKAGVFATTYESLIKKPEPSPTPAVSSNDVENADFPDMPSTPDTIKTEAPDKTPTDMPTEAQVEVTSTPEVEAQTEVVTPALEAEVQTEVVTPAAQTEDLLETPDEAPAAPAEPENITPATVEPAANEGSQNEH